MAMKSYNGNLPPIVRCVKVGREPCMYLYSLLSLHFLTTVLYYLFCVSSTNCEAIGIVSISSCPQSPPKCWAGNPLCETSQVCNTAKQVENNKGTNQSKAAFTEGKQNQKACLVESILLRHRRQGWVWHALTINRHNLAIIIFHSGHPSKQTTHQIMIRHKLWISLRHVLPIKIQGSFREGTRSIGIAVVKVGIDRLASNGWWGRIDLGFWE